MIMELLRLTNHWVKLMTYRATQKKGESALRSRHKKKGESQKHKKKGESSVLRRFR